MNTRVQCIAVVLIGLLLWDIVRPTLAWALTSGPGQPEVQGFTPIGNTDMVDLFTGDFSYNIPLFDVEGYPVNLAYRAGITMDQEASWVGLGWSLTPGSVERNLRGIPDDFNSDPMTRELHLRPQVTVGGQLGADFELFAINLKGPEVPVDPADSLIGENALYLGASLGANFSNYDGVSFSIGLTPSMRWTRFNKGSFTADLGLSSSSHDGMRVQPNVSFDRGQDKSSKRTTGALSIGLAVDSQEGLKNISFNASVKHNGKTSETKRKDKDGNVIMRNNIHRGKIGTAFDLGMPTYTPMIPMPMKNVSYSGSFKLGSDNWGAFLDGTLSGYYAKQELMTDRIVTPAYGYLHLQGGQAQAQAQLDFNREKDGGFTSDQTALPIAQLTNDLFTVTGQNISGSYRAFRTDIGHVFDPRSGSSGSGGAIGVEVGFGASIKWGVDAVVNNSSSWSGDWSNGNAAGQHLRYREIASSGPLVESVYFGEANEVTVDSDGGAQYNALRMDDAVRPAMVAAGAYDMKVLPAVQDKNQAIFGLPLSNIKEDREPRAQPFSYLTHKEVKAGFGVMDTVDRGPGSPVSANGGIPDHHMSEVTITGADGARNIYGIPAYNITQKDVTFAIDPNKAGADDPFTTHVAYTAGEAASGHPNSKDQYRSAQWMPKYAHSFLLTSVLGPDYSDVDGIRGPSPGDLGGYTKFSYTLFDKEYGWRTPMYSATTADLARLDRGNLATRKDDKASYSYGSKELWYLQKIEGRNLIAVFTTSDRKDGFGAFENGTKNSADKQQKLDKITLYERRDYEANGASATPIKTVHFVYDYSLCTNIPNALSPSPSDGKLTLKRVYFTYGTSNRGTTSPYVFGYSSINPGYDADLQDRWGQYNGNLGVVPLQDFPYADQDASKADQNAGAWNLTTIGLPSGGIITVTYECDDYGYVQDKEVTRMFMVSGVDYADPPLPDLGTPVGTGYELPTNLPLMIKIPADLTGYPAEAFTRGIDQLYFRARVNMDATGALTHDFVSGYARVAGVSKVQVSGDWYLRLALQNAPLDGDGDGCGSMPSPQCVNPIYRAAMDHLRLNYPREAYSPQGFSENDPFSEQLIESAASAGAGLLTGLGDLFKNPNRSLKDKDRFCKTFDATKSWVRLREPDHGKKGGGHRVREISYTDAWADMGSGIGTRQYGQKYTYTDTAGMTSGVAAYEPMIGADENPWRRPFFYSSERKWTSDERFYQEEPFGESMFPGPSVGYARVTVQDLYTDGPGLAASQGTGTVVSEFYTAKDFPVILDRTDIQERRRRSNFSLLSLLGVKMTDNNHTSQGFVVQTNDMHGKPKRTTVYPQAVHGTPQLPVSYVEYVYRTKPYGNALRLDNDATTIASDGTIREATIGRQVEVVTDMRDFGTKNTSGGLALNSELMFFIIGAFWFPIPLPKYSVENTRYRSAVLVKKIHRFGLLDKVVKMENGSVVSTENLAYDAHTGAVLLTRTKNDFEDPVHSLSFPAYWHYAGMGPAYKNLGASWRNMAIDGGSNLSLVDADKVFVEGDELAMWPTNGSPPQRGWVDQVTPAGIHILNAFGGPISDGDYHLKVVRSGRRNLMGTNMSSITTLSDPLQGFASNVYDRILQARTIEMSDDWRAACACLTDSTSNTYSNPYRLNQRGVWRLSKEDAWLTMRTRSMEDNNTDIRRDGVYATYDPFYKLAFGKWYKEPTGWTLVREVTQYGPMGQEVENKDALGLYSSATFSHGGTLPRSVARNAMYKETGFESFEEGEQPLCMDKHFTFDIPEGAITDANAHTGRHCVRVTSGAPVVLRASTDDCACTITLTAVANPISTVRCFDVNGCGSALTIELQVLYGVYYEGSAYPPTIGTSDFCFRALGGGVPGAVQVSITDEEGRSLTQLIEYP